jgi:hypothetical protein
MVPTKAKVMPEINICQNGNDFPHYFYCGARVSRLAVYFPEWFCHISRSIPFHDHVLAILVDGVSIFRSNEETLPLIPAKKSG